MRIKRLVSLLLGMVSLCFAVSLQATNQYDRILFVGNSFSFYNNGIHNHLGSLVRSAGEWELGVNRFRLSTLSGGRLSEHSADLAALLAVENSRWDTLVLQAHSNEAIHPKRKADFATSLAAHTQLIRSHGIEPVLFMTWGYKSDAKMSKELAIAYAQAAKLNQLKLIPVGLAFSAVEHRFPHIDLFVPDVLGLDEDGNLTYRSEIKHPSNAGTYLAACVFYAALYGKSPKGLPFTAGLDNQTATLLQQVAWQTVSEFNAD